MVPIKLIAYETVTVIALAKLLIAYYITKIFSTSFRVATFNLII